ncbi:ubiquinol-cytochrome c reductase cytochrome c subunit [Lipingzhangella halophila]|uniref:Ubiquinol-cytochrome c reductase cytochrome c subunit n=1 Tax=Lipingzhangella halophila TaxID=1783352 RepID=A0A7W7RG64_9ACTN|nr:cytochrome c [Lipingzhangella halophila]MBB4930821.1 ubiquinol-cytochrome c reductase cytochrome c subunit [Lipingzhangella halophila]
MKWITARRRHPLAGYVVVTLALALFGLGYAVVAPEPDQAQAQELAADTEDENQVDIAQGKQIYTESCASCHGPDGTASAREDVPDITDAGGAAVDFQVSTGRMPSMDPDAQMPRKPAAFDQDEIDNLVAYYEQELSTGGPGVPIDVPAEVPEVPEEPERADFPNDEAFETAHAEYEEAKEARDNYEDYIQGVGDNEAGQKLYLANCAHCHSWSGGGGALTGGEFAPEIRESSPRQIYEAMTTGPGAMPVFNDTTITPEEKQDLISHVRNLETEPDAGGFFDLNRVGQVAEGFIGWTVGLSLIVACAIWITAKQRAHD